MLKEVKIVFENFLDEFERCYDGFVVGITEIVTDHE